MKYKLIALLAASLMVTSCGKSKKDTGAEGDTSPDKTATNTSKVGTSIAAVVQRFNGEEYVPDQITGDPDYFIMYFTASWWPPCRRSVPQLVEKYNNKIANLDNLELVQVSVDKSLPKAVEWAKKESFPWPTILMTDIKETMVKDIKTNAVPTYVLIDKEGKEIARAHDSASVMKKFEEVSK